MNCGCRSARVTRRGWLCHNNINSASVVVDYFAVSYVNLTIQCVDRQLQTRCLELCHQLRLSHSFCRAMRCTSNAYVVMQCLSVCLCPSVTFVDHVKTNKRIFKICSPDSQAILVFPHQTSWHYSDGNPPNGGVECKGYEKNDEFRPIYRFISEMMQDRAIVTMESK